MSELELNIVDLDQPLEGYHHFLSCWVCRKDGLVYLVDPGPRSTIEYLIDSIRKLGIGRVDYIVATHIHLDHLGGAAQVLEAFPGSRLYCHESGVKHVVDPTLLWQGSKKVLREVAEVYGEPSPVEAHRIADIAEIEKTGIRIIPTPGHAVHHVSFAHDDVLFAGEAVGCRVKLKSGRPYLRPAMPPRFMLNVAVDSLDRLLALEEEPRRIVFAHYGMDETGAFAWLKRARTQINSWVGLIRTLHAVSPDDLEQRLFDELMQVDPLYGQGAFDELPADIRARERYFLSNTLEGMLGYIKAVS
jgi:glyoxylase-like metal-dependent hydrolase (beta-lactamase superfamily II)